MVSNSTKYILLSILILIFFCPQARSERIISSRHNLSVSGPGPIKAAYEDRVCIFCHAPRKSIGSVPFLWNRKNQTAHYTPYKSSTLYSNVGQPTGASRVCLSCHDGTIALGSVFSKSKEMPFTGGIRFMPQGPSRLGTDLSDDHPISFVYNSRLSWEKGELKDPSMLPKEVRLDKNEELQCTSCHNPHDDTFGKFLVMPNQYSVLCTTCHIKDGWVISTHAVSYARKKGAGPDPWPDSDYQTVAENGCENCHAPHTAEAHERLLKHVFEEDNCLVCHNGNVASTDIDSALTRSYRHSVQDYNGVHDAAEDFTTGDVPKHVECADCHNPHRANDHGSSAPSRVSGANTGVTGVSAGGQQITEAQNLYEICFKCHADNNALDEFSITRQIDQLNTRLEFDPANPSFHPVESPGNNYDVPSLLQPLTKDSIISCIDCHSSDNPNEAKGPHGSMYKYILVRNYVTADFTRENSNNYALCYKCHSRGSILGNQSFPKHRSHIIDQKAPCAACHDPHGISNMQGNTVNNSHLINFDISIVFPNDQGSLYFQDLGRFTGQCFLKCHGKEHEPEMYP